MFGSLLIANRGEIAARIARTARAMGLRVIAVYSDADEQSRHVREADARIAIGPGPARDSYLCADKIIAAAKATGAEAIHPGYGFLSENADFAEAVTQAGLIFVGPPAAAIRAMGLKDAAKARMAAAGVAVTPGYAGEDQSLDRLQSEAERIGYPVLIKAVAGGGGKGMRKVLRPEDFSEALTACRREAQASFGDDKVLLEIYVPRPRHIEVQVFFDRFGSGVHLYERDCSLQRRHQKVIEEAPAPGMTAEIRATICEAALRAAKAVDYVGAGTVEFIADASQGLRADRIWFMEMNTRLQVEHPVTEAVTGLDLVEWQLRIAAGEPLPLGQSAIPLNGVAIEARLYAEQPATGFLPSTGPLTHFRLPRGVRIDTGVEQGGEISPFYDPMIAKLIVHAPTRRTAAQRLAEACAQVEVYPVATNAGFLARVLRDDEVTSGAVHTGLIAERGDSLTQTPPISADALQAASMAFVTPSDGAPWTSLPGFRINAAARFPLSCLCAGQPTTVQVDPARPTASKAFIYGDLRVSFAAGEAYVFQAPDPAALAGESDGDGQILAPMPGRIISVAVAQGAKVQKGTPLLTLEAMKMEHVLTAPFDGQVGDLAVGLGDQVQEGSLLARLERPG